MKQNVYEVCIVLFAKLILNLKQAFIQDLLQLSHTGTPKSQIDKETKKLTTPISTTTIENCDIEFNQQMLLTESDHELVT